MKNETSQRNGQTRRRFIGNGVGSGVLLASGFFKLSGSTAYAKTENWDLIVVGSGAAGMTAALRAKKRGLNVLLIEKAATFGGSTARSGAGIWIRNNSVNNEAGLEDSFEEASEYLAQVVGDNVPLDKQESYLREGPKMLDFVMANSPLRFQYMKGYSDYYPKFSGSKKEGASIEPQMFNGKLLGSELKNLQPPYIPTPAGVVIYSRDYKWLAIAKVSARGVKAAAQSAARYVKAKLLGQVPLTMGQALAAGLRVGLQRAKVDVWLKTPLLDLELDAQGKVVGAVVQREGTNTLLKAKYGVVMASGGFEHNLKLREQYQPYPASNKWTMGAKTNTGDGILAGKKVGADLDLMDDSWWGPTIPLSPTENYFCLSERSLPGSIMVNAEGKRFTDEAAPYHDVVNAMYRQNVRGEKIVTWLITDQEYRNRYLFKDTLPGFDLPKSWYENGAVFKKNTLDELAEELGMEEGVLSATVERFNQFAEAGVDLDYSRGDNEYSRYYSDPSVKPNPSLGKIDRGPFYAYKIVPGDIGTKGGLVTDAQSRVLTPNGDVIPGLYAAGNASNGVMGRSYAGAGSTLGPAMTFGFIAADHVADNI